jgi:hypothetical protein
MLRTTISVLVLAPVAGALAWWTGGPLGLGIALGFLVGAGVAATGVAYQRHVLRRHPEQAMTASLVAFGAKLMVVGMSAFAMHFLPQIAERMDWTGFLLSFVAASLAILLIGTADAVSVLKLRSVV